MTLETRLRKLIKNPTSENDLHKLAGDLGIKIQTGRLKDIDQMPNNLLVLNLDNYGNGNHWIAHNREKNMSMDSYAFLQARLGSYNKQIQSLDAKMCGPLSVLWLYYTDKFEDGNDRFYKLFKDVYKG